MNRSLSLYSVVAAGLLLAGVASAQTPAGSTGQCNDGSYSTQASKKGACRGHKGVKEWYAANGAAAAPATAAAPAAAAAPTAPAMPAKPAATTRTQSTQFTPPAVAASGGGAGMVWVNGKVYHCMGDKWYGKTKSGSYMSEADAKAKGAHGDHGKACTT